MSRVLARLVVVVLALGASLASAQAPAEPQVVYVQAPAADPAPAPASTGIDMAQLKQLGDLHAAGILTDEEFAAAKAKLLG